MSTKDSINEHLVELLADERKRRVAAEEALARKRDIVGVRMQEIGRIASAILELDESKCQDLHSFAMCVRGWASVIRFDTCKYGVTEGNLADEEYCVQHAQDDAWEIEDGPYPYDDMARASADEYSKKNPTQKYRVAARIVSDWRSLEVEE